MSIYLEHIEYKTHDELCAVVGLHTWTTLRQVPIKRQTTRCAQADDVSTDRESFRPHQTPIPAIDTNLPLPLHAPSEYTTSQPLSSSSVSVARFHLPSLVLPDEDGFEIVWDTDVTESAGAADAAADVDDALMFAVSPGTNCATYASASAALLNFLYRAPANPIVCASHSSLPLVSVPTHGLFSRRTMLNTRLSACL